MPLDISRRNLLLSAAGGTLAGMVAPRSSRAADASDTPRILTAGSRTLEVNGRAAKVFGITQPNGTYGLYTEVGTPFRVALRNGIGQDTLIHWHGLTPPYRQDGVPGLSAPPVPPGGEAQYDFPLTFPGTFWMHAHRGLQEQSLMSAPLIIRERKGTDRQEVVLMLHDFSFKSPEEIFAGLRHGAASNTTMSMGMDHDQMAGGDRQGMAMGDGAGSSQGGDMAMGAMDGHSAGMAMDLNDVAYDAFLANDRTLADPEVVRVEPRGRILLRVINASAASNFQIDLGQVRASLVAVDGRPMRPLAGSVFPIAMAQRLDLELDLADQTVVPVLAGLEGERKRTGIVLATARGQVRTLPELAPAAAPPLGFAFEQQLRAVMPLPPKPADRVHRVALTGSMQNYVWEINGRIDGQDQPLMVTRGQRVELVMTNHSMMSHPMHLHGHAFQVVAFNGKRFSGAVRDTVLVPAQQSVTVAFDADNPGLWAFHCHNLYHMAAGMMTTVRYENT